MFPNKVLSEILEVSYRYLMTRIYAPHGDFYVHDWNSFTAEITYRHRNANVFFLVERKGNLFSW